VGNIQILGDPCDKVILEGAFDNLMKEVRRQKLMNICPRKVASVRLIGFFSEGKGTSDTTHDNVGIDPILVPQNSGTKRRQKRVSMAMLSFPNLYAHG
jgi:hypothetical protein